MTLTASRPARLEASPIRGHIPGEPGLWIVIFVELVMFGLYFCAIGYYTVHQPAMVESSQGHLNQTVAAINTVLLITGSLFVALGVQDARAGRLDSARRNLLLGVASAVGFGAFKAYEYGEKFAVGIVPSTNFFFQSYFVFTALHMLHVVLAGVLLCVGASYAKSAQKTRTRLRFIEGVGCYWHMVDLIWVGLYAVLYLV
ncbi:MAG: cytochrome c oxidase subunit 3 [Segniliparus sp.]|uniref:cytochrome c oxidase subunit 3 n=1 Tax=Segniliparus sp. TaxID=2804064 RepID=UPI003F330B3D